MDRIGREITKIAREVNKLVIQTVQEDGIGSGEIDFIHLLRHHPGMTQAEVRKELNLDKGAAARRAASLEAKGYLIRKENPEDRRSQFLYATEKAEGLKTSKAAVESVFYDWLLAELPEEEREIFVGTLEKLYLRAKKQSRSGFPEVKSLLNGDSDAGESDAGESDAGESDAGESDAGESDGCD